MPEVAAENSASEKPKDSVQDASGAKEAIAAFQDIFSDFELKVLAAIGLLIGYICMFYEKILGFQEISVGVFGIVLLTLLLLSLNPKSRWTELLWWRRSAVVVFVCLLLTSPQLYYAWNVSLEETQTRLEKKHQADLDQSASQNIAPKVSIQNWPDGGQK